MNTPKIGVAVICRYNSSRLKGKILKEICGQTILMRIVQRLRLVLPNDQIVVTTSVEKTDDIIIDFCKKNQLKWFRGSLDNVANRILNVGEEFEWDYIIRLNGDNLFIDLDLMSELIKLAETNVYDFISNVKGRTYPYGMSIELFKRVFYKRIYDQFIKGNKRYEEHVTLYLYENEEEGKYYFKQNLSVREASGLKLSIDTNEDFEKANVIMKRILQEGEEYNLRSLTKIFKDVI